MSVTSPGKDGTPDGPSSANSAPSPRPHDPYAAWRSRDFRYYLGGQFCSQVAGAMQTVAISWEIWKRTEDPMALAWVGLVQAAPVMAFSLPAGHVADRVDRRRIIMTVLLVQALVALALAALSWWNGPLALIYACLFVAGVDRAFLAPAGAAMLPRLVPREVFPNAVTWRSSLFQFSAVAGPALGGVALAVLPHPALIYVANACAISVFFGFLANLAPQPPAGVQEAPGWDSLVAGLRFVWNTKIILAAITLDLFAVLFGGATALLPIYAKEILHQGAIGFGQLRAAPGFGAILMGLYLAHQPPLRRAGRTLLLAVTGFGAATIVFGVSTSFWLSLAMLCICGALDQVSVVVRHTLVQTRTPDHMRGRVSAVNMVFISASNELGEFESGVVARLFTPVVSAVSGGVGTLLVVLAVAGRWPELRRLGPLVEQQRPAPPADG